MSQKHFANLSQGILGEPDPIDLWIDQINKLSPAVKKSIKSGTKIVCPTVGQGSEIQALMSSFNKDWDMIKDNVIADFMGVN